eukprot:19302-Pyramimonas_sp.AAC.1
MGEQSLVGGKGRRRIHTRVATHVTHVRTRRRRRSGSRGRVGRRVAMKQFLHQRAPQGASFTDEIAPDPRIFQGIGENKSDCRITFSRSNARSLRMRRVHGRRSPFTCTRNNA